MLKSLKNITFIAAFLALSLGVVFVTVKLSDRYLSNEASHENDCSNRGVSHTVTIQDKIMKPKHTDAKLCDTLTIVNKDNELRLVAFGVHDHPVAYDNVSEKPLKKDQSFTITLDKTGTYIFHDHLDEDVEGDFTVTQ
jgi:plastocyanin